MREEIKEYFKNCKYVTQAPGAIFIEGNKYTRKAKVLPIPLYAYAGLEVGEGNLNLREFRFFEEQDITDSEKEVEKNIIKFSNLKNFSLFSIDRRNRLFYFSEHFDKDLSEDILKVKDTNIFSKYIKIKLCSDIPPNAGLNESSAIACAIALLMIPLMLEVELEEGKDMQGELIKFESLKKKKIMCKEVAMDYSFGKFFLPALGFDFFSNGATILASLLGLSKEEEIIDYECLGYDRLEEFLRADPKAEFERKPNGNIISEYERRCFQLSHRFFHEGTPLYRCNYINLSSFLKQKEPIELLVRSKQSPLEHTSINTKIDDTNVKCFMIYPYSVAIFGSLKTIKFYERSIPLIFKSKRRGKGPPIYRCCFNSWEKGWETEGARLVPPEEYKLVKPSIIVSEELKPEPKEEKLEINFEKGKIKIGSTVKSKYKQIFELLEYFISKGEDVHWIEGIRIFDDWKKIRNDIYNLKTIFEVIISRLRGPKGFFKNNNLNLDITNLDKGFYRLEGSYSSNIIKARQLAEQTDFLVNTGKFNIDEVKQKIKKAIEIYRNCPEVHTLIIKLLKNNIEFSEKDLIPSRRFFTKQIQLLEQVKSTVEYYKNNLHKIKWNKLKPEKIEEVQNEFKNEIGFFLIMVQQGLDEMKAQFDILAKWPEARGLSLDSEREFEEFKKLLEQNKIQDLLKTDIIKRLWGITKGILIDRLPYIRKWKDKEIDNYVTEILSDAIYDAMENIDFSKVSSFTSFKKYLLKYVKNIIYNDFFERIKLTKAEWKDYKEVERIKEELRQKFGREPKEEEWKEPLLEKRKRGEEYFKYIKDVCDKAKAIVSLDRDIAQEDEESSEENGEESD